LNLVVREIYIVQATTDARKTDPRGLSCLWFTVLATVCSVSCSQQEAPSAAGDRLNVLVITLDTIRADRLGAYGNPNIRTDFVDGLADQGVLFDRGPGQQ